MDVSVKKFVFDDKPIDCKGEYGMPLVESNETSLYVNESVISSYNLTDISQLRCCYTPFWRVELKWNPSGDYPSNVDTHTRFASTCTTFIKEATINHEFVKVECFANNKSIYVDYHAFIPTTAPKEEKEQYFDEQTVSVLMIGVDGVSRLNLHRQMPLTVNFLKKYLNAEEMLGYNKVDENTFPNLIPVLTGLSEKELKASCWLSSDAVFDNCSYIWDDFKALGYKTAFVEDASWMGIFNYLKRGFRKQPTDYYRRVFDKVSEDAIGFDTRLNARVCVGPRLIASSVLDYVSKFVMAMKNIPSFCFMWGASLSHDYLNLPKQGDKVHVQFLQKWYDQGIFNHTILVFMSDHGIRWGGIRQTYQGFLEERLPFLFIAYPEWFRLEYTTAIRNLKKNAQKLTTAFDLHESLIDLTNLSQLSTNVLQARSRELEDVKSLPRGISLFLPIPGSRTCLDADIADNWCTCHQSTSIPTNNTNAVQAANYLVKSINSLVEEYPKCAKLRLNKILGAREQMSASITSFKSSDAGIKDFSLTITTTPGDAQFEATVRYEGNTDTHKLVGSVSRINLYGDQSKCVKHYKLRLYCYCIDS